MQRGLNGKGQKNAMTVSAGCAVAVAVTNGRCSYQQKTCTHTRTLEESMLGSMESRELGERQKG